MNSILQNTYHSILLTIVINSC